LTAAFLAVVLGPVLVCALAVGFTVSSVADARAGDRLASGAATVRTALAGQCRTARAAAEAVAAGWRADGATTASPGPAATTGGSVSGAAASAVTRVVDAGLVDSALLEDSTGQVIARAGKRSVDDPAGWVDCAGGGTGADAAAAVAIAATVELRDQSGRLLAVAKAARAVDTALAIELSSAAGVDVTLRAESGDRGGAVSTLPAERATRTVQTAVAARPNEVTRTDGLLVIAVPAVVDQPIRVVLTTPRNSFGLLYAGLGAAVLLVAVAAVLLAWRLAQTTTRPLAEVVRAAEAVAAGELAARVPVRGRDEVARLAKTFNRMTREMQAYVEALTTSRDQLRGNLALIGDTLSSTHDLDRILEVILETVTAATGARAGIVMLTAAGPGRAPAVLVGRCGQGLSGRGPGGAPVELASLRLAMGEGLLGAVAARAEARHGQIGEDGLDQLGTRPALGEPTCRTFIAVPFSRPAPSGAVAADADSTAAIEAGGAATDGGPAAADGGAVASGATDVRPADPSRPPLGVLALYDRLGADDFDDGDLVTLRTFAGQAAVAVENVLLHEETRRLSLTDPLTGLWNYRYLQDSLRREVERASRFRRPVSVLLIDLDRFKTVNDTYGHPVGDAVLAEVARRISGAVREVDFTFRQGGEEFVVLLPEADAEGATRVCERLLDGLRTGLIRLPASGPGGREVVVRVTASIGFAVCPTHAQTVEELLERADLALYAAKSAGRDTYRAADYED
jgi:diguanylate cyclase (GGDEF)-like protein